MATEVYCWGGDHSGQLGLSSKTPGRTYNVPRFCCFSLAIRAVSCGEDHCALVTSTGEVYTIGSNAEGRLGIGNRTLRCSSTPVKVETLVGCKVTNVSCGWTHTSVLTDTSDLYSWGSGEHGALGSGSCESQWLPVLIRVSRDYSPQSISCGARHSLILGENRSGAKEVWSCGSGEAGQLGTGRREKELTFVRIVAPEGIRQAACGVFHTGLVGVSGRVYTMGGNSFGQLGLGHKKSCSTLQRVSALDAHTIVKVACGNHSAAISDRGQLFLWGSGSFGEFLTPQMVGELQTKARDVEVGGTFGAALDSSGNVWTWGNNTNGELGLGDYESRQSPTMLTSLQGKSIRVLACGGSFCYALSSDSAPSPLRPENRTTTHLVERPSNRASHGRSITSMGFERSPLRGGLTHTPERLIEKETTRNFVVDTKLESRRLRDSAGQDRRTLDTRQEDLQRRKTSKGQTLEAQAEEQRKDNQVRLERQLESQKSEIESLKAYIDEMAQEKQSLLTQLSQSEETVQDYRSSLDSAHSSLIDLETTLRAKDKELDMLKRSYNEELERRDAQIDSCEQKDRLVEELEDKLHACESELRAQAEQMEERLESLKRENTELHYNSSRLEKEKQASDSEIDRLSKAQKTMKDQVRDGAAAHQALASEAEQLRKSLASKESEYQALRREFDLVLRENKQNTSCLNQLQMLIVEREGECEEYVKEKEAAEETAARLNLSVDERNAEIQHLKDELNIKTSENDVLRTEAEDLVRQIDAEKSDGEELRNRIRRLEESFAQTRDRLQTEIQQKTEERQRLIEALKTQKSKSEGELQSESLRSKKLEEDLRRNNDDYLRLEQLHQEAVSNFEAKLADMTQRFRSEENAKCNLNEDLEAALASVKQLEDSLRCQEKAAESDLKSLQASMHLIEDRYEGQIESLNRALNEERDKRQLAESELNREKGESRRLGDICDSLNRKTDSLSKESERMRITAFDKESQARDLEDRAKSAERDFTALQGEYQRLKSSLSQCQSLLQTRENDLKSANERANELNESTHQLQMAVDRLSDEKARFQKQNYDLTSVMEKQKRTTEDLNEKLNIMSQKLDEMKSANIELEGKNRDLFIRMEKENTGRTRTQIPPSPIRPSLTEIVPTALVPSFKPMSPERRTEIDSVPRFTPDRSTVKRIDPSPLRNKPWSPLFSSDATTADVRGKLNSYREKKAEFETHLQEIQRRMEESGKAVDSSMATSRINSPLVSFAAAKSEAAGTKSSNLSRVSVREAINAAAQKLDQSSLRTSLKSRISLSTALCEFLEANLIIDEYGFTDKLCKKCQNRLSLEEILALCVPMAVQRNEIDMAAVKIDDAALICLSCYADIVTKRAGLKQPVARLVDLKPVATSMSEDAKSQKPQTRSSEKRGGSVQPEKHVPLLPAVKPPSPAQIKSSTSHSLQRRKRTYTPHPDTKIYDIIKGKARPSPGMTATNNFRKATDITQYADAMFAGGVFKNPQPGQSL